MQKKDDKMGNKTAHEAGERQRKKWDHERKIEIDARNTKKLLDYLRLDGKRPFSVAKLIFSHVYALAANQSSKEELVKNAFFWLFPGRHQRVNHVPTSHMDQISWPAFLSFSSVAEKTGRWGDVILPL